MSHKTLALSKKRLIIAAVLMIIITAAAVLIGFMSTLYLVMYISDINTRYITYDPLRYIVGTVSDHILTIDGKEISLRDLCGRNAKVVFEVTTPFEILTKGLL